jgi:hypothetical protein
MTPQTPQTPQTDAQDAQERDPRQPAAPGSNVRQSEASGQHEYAAELPYDRAERMRRGPTDGLEPWTRALLRSERPSLPVLHAPPMTRAGCAEVPRPDGLCTRTGCRLHSGILEEHPGRPHPSTPSKPPHVVRRHAACALDVVDRFPDGAPSTVIAEELGMGLARARQLELRALLKVRAASLVVGRLEELELPSGCRLEIAYPRSHDSGAIHLHVTVHVPPVPLVADTGLRRYVPRDHQAGALSGNPEKKSDW